MAIKGFNDWYRGFIQGKTRITFAWIFSIVLVFCAQDYPTLPGIILCFIGATIRVWGSGYLHKDNQLSVYGPYSWTRNPLYLGTYLMALGVALAIEAWILLAVITVTFAAMYHFIILDEETKLKRIFGERYEIYCQLVWRFFPRPWPASRAALDGLNPSSSVTRFSWQEAMGKNKAYEAYLAFAAMILGITAIAWIWKNLT